MGAVWQDVRYSLRILAKQRAFSLVAILTLALAIGATSALFSVIDAALLHPLPYPHPEQLVTLHVEESSSGAEPGLYGPSLAEARGWQTASHALARVCVGRSGGRVVADTGDIERVTAVQMSEGCLEMYCVAPIVGRGIQLEDTRADSPAVVLLGYGYWRSRFGGSTNVLGQTIRLADGPATIVGVLPASFERKTAIVRALRVAFKFPGAEERRGLGTSTFARLRPDVTAAQAAAELGSMVAAGRGGAASRVKVDSMYDDTTFGYARTIRTLAGAVTLILLLACVNVAGLLLARGAARQPELAVRMSLGAGRSRIVRQLLTESLMLGVAAGLLGLGLAWVSLDALVSVIPLTLPGDAPAVINARVIAFTGLAALSAALLFGVVPALRLSRAAGARGIGQTASLRGSALTRRNGQILIAGEVALAMVLLAGAAVMIRSFARLVSVDLGFDPERVTAMQVVPGDAQPAVLAGYYPELLRAVRAIPGIESAGAVDNLPLVGGSTSTRAFVKGVSQGVEISQVLPGYFEAMDLRLLAGRFPVDADTAPSRPAVVVDEAAATALFPGVPAVGQRVQISNISAQAREVVGVVKKVRQWGAQSPASFLRPKVTCSSARILRGRCRSCSGCAQGLHCRPNSCGRPHKALDLGC